MKLYEGKIKAEYMDRFLGLELNPICHFYLNPDNKLYVVAEKAYELIEISEDIIDFKTTATTAALIDMNCNEDYTEGRFIYAVPHSALFIFKQEAGLRYVMKDYIPFKHIEAEELSKDNDLVLIQVTIKK